MNPKRTETTARHLGPAALVVLLGGACTIWTCPAQGAATIIHVTTPQVTLIPSAQDYANDYVEATGGAGIQVRTKTNSPSGLILKVRSSGNSNTIRLGDLLVRTLTPPGNGGTSATTWRAVALTDFNLWSIAVGTNQFQNVAADTRVINLGGYADNVSAGFTSYSHTVIFTVVSP